VFLERRIYERSVVGARLRAVRTRGEGRYLRGEAGAASSFSVGGGVILERRRRGLPPSSQASPSGRQPPDRNARGGARFGSTPTRRVSAGFVGPKQAKTGLPNSS
jgi:hypothetical protein